MRIRTRLSLSFALILSLFGLNLFIHLWSNYVRASGLEAVRRAISLQSTLSSIEHRLSDFQKQITLLAQMPGDALSAADIAGLNSALGVIETEIQRAVDISEPNDRDNLLKLRASFRRLAPSWRIFFENVGKDPARAITELSIRGEPLGAEVIHKQLPELERHEEDELNAATAEVYKIAKLTGNITFGIFLLSIALAILTAVLFSRYLTTRLERLRVGAALIGRGFFDQTIDVPAGDELGHLAKSFNEMRVRLRCAHEQLTGQNEELQRRHDELESERRTSESLLLNILPQQIATELRLNGAVQPRIYEDVTIMFTDFVRFSVSTEEVPAEELVRVLHEYFTAFDEIVTKYGLEKLKTIGDSYMCAGGLSEGLKSHPVDTVLAAMELLSWVRERSQAPDCKLAWDVRIGIHTGPVIAGVVGIKKFAFDLWGTTVNFSSRMESSGVPNRINISEPTVRRISEFFEYEHRGKILTKDNRLVDMYFVNGIKSELRNDIDENCPAAFAAAYARTFEHALPSFPPKRPVIPELGQADNQYHWA